VLTANYTYTSARQQLELVWVVDVTLDGTARPEDRADVVAAGAFVRKLLEQLFYREPKAHKLTERLDDLLAVASDCAESLKPLPKKLKARFVHSLGQRLYDQIKDRFQAEWKDSRRNLLLCGSGFYERPSSSRSKPEVLVKLEQLDIFNSSPRLVAIVEPSEAGAMANWLSNGKAKRKEKGWELYRSIDVLNLNRKLHAKFIYAGYLRDGRISNGSLYLGSGNLSKRGLLSSRNNPLTEMVGGNQKKVWNIEAGVVFKVNDGFAVKQQYDKKGEFTEDAVARRLFWLEGKNEDLPWEVGRVGDASEDESLIEAPPILSATIETAPTRGLRLLWREDFSGESRVKISWTGRYWFDVKRGDEVPLQNDEDPAALNVSGESDRRWVVPVVDAAGRVGWQPPRFDTYADALAALLDFPIRLAEATDDDDDEGKTRKRTKKNEKKVDGETVEQEKNYALHAAAELVEKVAALQAALPESMLDDWLDHLDRMFRASFPEVLITSWREHGINVFEHLKARELRPPHLSDERTQAVKKYIAILDMAARAWGLVR
jgi:hypothetical protein